MARIRNSRSAWVLLLCHSGLAATAAFGQLNEQWTLSVNGQSVQVNADGTFRVRNIAAPDLFGPLGPGTVADFLSDDFYRLAGSATINGTTTWVFSEYFQIAQGATYAITDLTFTNKEPPAPESVEILAPASVLAVGEQTQLTVMATLSNGTTQDVSTRSLWTVYRTSNLAVATVSENGLVTAIGDGIVFITAVNDGATAVKRLDVFSSTVQTTIEGLVFLDDGSPVVAAEVSIDGFGDVLSGVDGRFFAVGTVGSGVTFSTSARMQSGDDLLVGFSQTIPVVPGGVTDLGIITVTALRRGPIFGNPQIDVGAFPMAIAAGDFDEDGNTDVAVANRDANTLSILSGRGEGRFDVSSVNVGTRPQAVRAGLLNADDLIDLAVANGTSNDVSVLINGGSGVFLPAVSYAAGLGARDLAIGRIDENATSDIVVANATANSLSVLSNNGDGTFASAVSYNVGRNPRSIALGDVNADLHLDIAVVNQTDLNVGILLNDGHGLFGAQTPYGAGGASFSPRAVAMGRLDADNHLDLAVTRGGTFSSSVAVFRNTGSGLFSAGVGYTCGGEPEGVAIGDVDGDADSDLIVGSASRGEASVLLNAGTGVFSAEVRYPAGTGVRAVDHVDLDGDGIKDLLTANAPINTVSVLLGQTGGTFGGDRRYATADLPFSIESGDLNGDQLVDLVVGNIAGDNVSILLGAGGGNFHPATNFPAGDSPLGTAVGDLDSDGDLDVAVANPSADTVSLLFNNGGELAAPIPIAVGTEPSSIVIIDLNHDQAVDLVVADADFDLSEVFVLLNDGHGGWPVRTGYPVPFGAIAVAATDLNGDLETDIISLNVSSFSVLLADGVGGFASAASYSLTSATNVRALSHGDLDEDGDPDLILNDAFSLVVVLRNNGDGTFSSIIGYGPEPGVMAASIDTGDIDLDGDIDIVAQDSAKDGVVVLLNDGTGAFGDWIRFGTGDDPIAIVLADFDQDHDLDLAAANSRADTVSVLLNRKR